MSDEQLWECWRCGDLTDNPGTIPRTCRECGQGSYSVKLREEPTHESLEWGTNCLNAPDRGPHECNGRCFDKHICLRCGCSCLCQSCNEGNMRCRSSVTERWVHTDTSIGRHMCFDPPSVSPQLREEPTMSDELGRRTESFISRRKQMAAKLREEPGNLWDTCTDCELPLPSCKCNVDLTAVNEPIGGMATGDAPSAYKLVLEQAEDEGLWFKAQYITEDYLQRALRALHAAVETDASKPSLSPEMAELRQLVKEYYDKHFCMDDDALVPERCKLCIKADALLPKESL